MIYWTAISLGLVSSLHCLGMCGPLVLMLPSLERNSWQVFASGLEYNLGRITTYILIGMIFGLLGQGLLIGTTQQYISVGLGIIILLVCLSGFNLEAKLSKFAFVAQLNAWIRKRFAQLLNRQKRHFFFGLLNGVLPCGMVYLALAGALTMAHTWQSAAFMFSFGLGTLPAMLAPFFLGHGIRQKLRPYLPYIQTSAMLLVGIFLITRGLNISFPEELKFWEMLNKPVMCH